VPSYRSECGGAGVAEVVFQEEVFGFFDTFESNASPGQLAAREDALDAEVEEAEAPGKDDGIERDNDEAEHNAPPADEFKSFVAVSEGIGCGSLGEVAQAEFEDEHGDTDDEDGDDVWDEEGATAVVVEFVWESPEISEADSGTDGGEDESASCSPAFTLFFQKLGHSRIAYCVLRIASRLHSSSYGG